MKTIEITDTTECNRLIAEFMGVKPEFNSYTKQYGLSKSPWWVVTGDTPEKVMQDSLSCFKYDSDWNELMPVVEKIEGLGIIVEIRDSVCYIETSTGSYISELGVNKIQSTYQAVVEFIKWFNQQPV